MRKFKTRRDSPSFCVCHCASAENMSLAGPWLRGAALAPARAGGASRLHTGAPWAERRELLEAPGRRVVKTGAPRSKAFARRLRAKAGLTPWQARASQASSGAGLRGAAAGSVCETGCATSLQGPARPYRPPPLAFRPSAGGWAWIRPRQGSASAAWGSRPPRPAPQRAHPGPRPAGLAHGPVLTMSGVGNRSGRTRPSISRSAAPPARFSVPGDLGPASAHTNRRVRTQRACAGRHAQVG